MTQLVDLQQVTVDICIQLIEIIQKRIDSNDESNYFDQVDHFLNVSLVKGKNQLIKSSFFFFFLSVLQNYSQNLLNS